MTFQSKFESESNGHIQSLEQRLHLKCVKYNYESSDPNVLHSVYSGDVYLGVLRFRGKQKEWKKGEDADAYHPWFATIPDKGRTDYSLRDCGRDIQDGELNLKAYTSEDDSCVSDGCIIHYTPSYLRQWKIDTIPEKVTVDGAEVNLRQVMMRRLASECPIMGFAHLIDVAEIKADWGADHWIEYAKYHHTCDGRFKVDYVHGFRIHPAQDLLASVRLMCTVLCDMYIAILPLRINDLTVMLEIHRYLMRDPLAHTRKLKTLFAPFINFSFMNSESGVTIDWPGFDYNKRSAKLRKGKRGMFTERRPNYVPEEWQREVAALFKGTGLMKTIDMLEALVSAEFNVNNGRSACFLRTYLAMCGFVGSEVGTAVINQVDAYKDFAPPTKESCGFITQTFKDVANMCLDLSPHTDRSLRLRRIPHFLTSASSGMMEMGKKRAIVMRHSHQPDGAKSVKLRAYKIQVDFKDKRMAYLSNSDTVFGVDAIQNMKPAHLGTRIVTGGKDMRIIFPIPLAPYLMMQLSFEPLNNVLIRRPSTFSHELIGCSGVGHEFGVPHETLAHLLYSSSTQGHAMVCTDFSTFDASQTGAVNVAENVGWLSAYDGRVDRDVSSNKSGSWIKWTPKEMLETVIPRDGSLFSFVGHSSGFKFEIRTSMLCSGVPHTSGFNTTRNIAEIFHQEKIARDEYGSELPRRIYANKIGDDSAVVRDLGEYDFDAYARTELGSACDAAKRGHLELSEKRTIIGTSRAEHIKVGICNGHILPNFQMPLIFSEKTFSVDLDPWSKVQTLLSNGSVAAGRTVCFDSFVKYLDSIMVLLCRVRSGDVDFYVGPGLKYCTHGGGIHPEVPILPNGFRIMIESDPFAAEMDAVYNWCATQLSPSADIRSCADEVTKNIKLSPHMFGVEKIDVEPRLLQYESVRNMNVERIGAHLAKQSIAGKSLPQIRQIGKDRLVCQIVDSARHGKRSSRTYKVEYADTYVTPEECAVPYLTMDRKLRSLISYLGLSHDNARVHDPATVIDHLMKSMPYSSPPHLSGADVITLLEDVAQPEWCAALGAVGCGAHLVQEIMKIAERVVASHRLYGSSSLSYYAGPIQYVNCSHSKLNECVTVYSSENLTRMDMLSYGMLHVMFQILKFGRSKNVVVSDK